jgi:hypothetical protein
MKRALLIIACVSLSVTLTGCDVLNYIWQHIVGHSYTQVDMSALETAYDSASYTKYSAAFPIDKNALTTNTVVGYFVRNSYYGKLAMLANADSTKVTFQFTTYDTDGSVLASSTSVTIGAGSGCDLTVNTGNEVTTSDVNDFEWRSDGKLVPTDPSVLWIFP